MFCIWEGWRGIIWRTKMILARLLAVLMVIMGLMLEGSFIDLVDIGYVVLIS